MPWYLLPLLIYLLLINLLAAFITFYDKKMAQKGKMRIPEKNLFILSLLGGSLAMYLTMKVIRHKTQKKKFMIGIPVIFLVELCMTGYLFYFFSF